MFKVQRDVWFRIVVISSDVLTDTQNLTGYPKNQTHYM